MSGTACTDSYVIRLLKWGSILGGIPPPKEQFAPLTYINLLPLHIRVHRDISGPNMRMRTRPPSLSFGNNVGFAWVLAQGRHEKPHKHMAGKKVWFCI